MLSLVPEHEVPRVGIQPLPLDTDQERLDAFKLCLKLHELCRNEKGIGIAAVQAGVPSQCFVVSPEGVVEGNSGYYVNCDYVRASHSIPVKTLEGCLSLRDPSGRSRFFSVSRHSAVRVTGHRLDVREGKVVAVPIDWILEGGIATVFQHEIDHCKGIMISDDGEEHVIW